MYRFFNQKESFNYKLQTQKQQKFENEERRMKNMNRDRVNQAKKKEETLASSYYLMQDSGQDTYNQDISVQPSSAYD